jgi:replication-associated recombination protein RarA
LARLLGAGGLFVQKLAVATVQCRKFIALHEALFPIAWYVLTLAASERHQRIIGALAAAPQRNRHSLHRKYACPADEVAVWMK